MKQSSMATVASGTPRSNNRLVLWQSAMAGLAYIAGAGVIGEVIPTKWAALLFALVGGLQTTTAAYVAGMKPVQTPVQVVTVDMHKP